MIIMENKIFIFGHYGEKNTGDDAMLYVLLQQLHNIYPNTNFSIISPRELFVPKEVQDKIKIIKPKPFNVFKEIKESSIFVMGGGTQIYDYGNKFERSKVLLEVLILVIWAKIFCEKISFRNIGIEPFNTTFRKFLSKKICKLADFITVRDSLSYEILENIDVKKLERSFDLAVLLNYNPLPKETKNNILGISLLPFYEIYHDKKELDQLVVKKIAASLNKWLKNSSKNKIRLFIFKGESRSDDLAITQFLKTKLINPEKVEIVPYNSNPMKTLSMFNECDMFIGMRYHSCLFAYATKTPLLIISYFQKCTALAEEIGLSERAVLNINEVLDGNFEEYFEDIQTNKDSFIAKLPISIAKKRAKAYFDCIFGGNL
jgi:polysaccharide pyruvyl transferase WcaK-like protein